MRAQLLGTFVAPLLVVLLVLTTPQGTGDAVHQDDLLHPLLPHVHLINGRLVTHQALEPDAGASNPNPPHAGPAIGGGAGSAAAGAGLGLSPSVPAPPTPVRLGQPFTRLALDLLMPTGRVEAPPDPPPTPVA
jgi:hypothetical protein